MFGTHLRAQATIWLIQLVTWYKCHVRICRNLYTSPEVSNSLWTVLRMRVGRLWLRIHLYGITLLLVHWNRGQFLRKTCHIRMCHIHISYRIGPLSWLTLQYANQTYLCINIVVTDLPLTFPYVHNYYEKYRLFPNSIIYHTKI